MKLVKLYTIFVILKAICLELQHYYVRVWHQHFYFTASGLFEQMY